MAARYGAEIGEVQEIPEMRQPLAAEQLASVLTAAQERRHAADDAPMPTVEVKLHRGGLRSMLRWVTGRRSGRAAWNHWWYRAGCFYRSLN